MKAAIIVPPLEDFYFSGRRFASLGASAGAKAFAALGFETEVIDFAGSSSEGRQIRLPDALSHLSPFIMPAETGPCSFFSTYRHFGPDTPTCAERIAGGGYDLAVFSVFAYCYADSAISVASELKKIKPSLPCGAAGAGVSVFPEYFSRFFDFVITGEAEVFAKWASEYRDWKEFLPAAAQGRGRLRCGEADGKIFPGGGFEKIHTADGEFPPSLGIAHSDRKNVFVSLSLTRGCPKKCRFCSNFITHGREFRRPAPGRLAEVLEENRHTFAAHAGKSFFINIEDDNLLCDTGFFFSSLEVLKSFFSSFADKGKGIFFSAENGLDYMLLDEKTCHSLVADYRFRQFNFTLGTADRNINLVQKRKSDTARLEGILEYLSAVKVPAVAYFIAGLENDTPVKTAASLILLDRLNVLSGISMFYAVPGLPGFTDFDSIAGLNHALFRGSSAWPWNNTLDTSQLVTAFRLSRTVNFLKRKDLRPGSREYELGKAIISRGKLFTLLQSGETVRPAGIDAEMEEMFFSQRV